MRIFIYSLNIVLSLNLQISTNPYVTNGFKRNAHTFIGNCPASLEKKTVFANHAKTGAVTTHLMSATKIVGKSRILLSIVSVHPGLSLNWAEFRPKDMLSRFGAQ